MYVFSYTIIERDNYNLYFDSAVLCLSHIYCLHLTGRVRCSDIFTLPLYMGVNTHQLGNDTRPKLSVIFSVFQR